MHIRTLTQTVYTRFERVGRIFLLRQSHRCFFLLILFFRILPVNREPSDSTAMCICLDEILATIPVKCVFS